MASYNCEKHGSNERMQNNGANKDFTKLNLSSFRKTKTAGLISDTKDGQYVKYTLTGYGKTVTKKLLSL